MYTLIFPFDYIIITIILLITLFSLLKGFIQSILGLLTWIGSILITIYSYNSTSFFLSKQLLNIEIFKEYSYQINIVSIIISIPLIFLISLFFLKKIRKILSSDLDRQILGSIFDKIFGFIYGVIFSYIMFTTVLILLERYDFNNLQNWLKDNSNIILDINKFNNQYIYLENEINIIQE